MIFITGIPRAGTTAVSNYIGDIFMEPFNYGMPVHNEGKVRREIRGLKKEEALRQLKEKGYRGFKEHSMSISPQEILELRYSQYVDKTLVLLRRNLFKQNMSFCISLKLDRWHGNKNFIRDSNIDYLDPTCFKHCLTASIKSSIILRELPDSKVVYYESLFEEKCESEWMDLSYFADVEFSPEKLKKIHRVRYNGEDTYSKIKNLPELKSIYKEITNESANCS